MEGAEPFDAPRGLREVIPNQTGYEKYKEFVVQTGGVTSTLQDIKLPDSAGGYVYTNPEGSPALANRTLYWRTMGDILELCEVSLNYDLVNNKVRYRFQDSPLLDGVSVHESWGQVVVLVPTVTSVHRLSFLHPTRMEKGDMARTEDGGLMSVLSEASVSSAREYEHVISWPSASPLPHIAATYFTKDDEEAVFVLGNLQGQLTCVRMGSVRGMTSVTQLASPSHYLGRVWTSLTARSSADRDTPLSLTISTVAGILVLVTVCRDHKVRVWNLTSGDCVLTTDLVQFLAEAGCSEMAQGTQPHRIASVEQEKGEERRVCVFLCFQQHSQFLILGLSMNAGQIDLQPRGTLYCPEHDLVGFSATSSGISAVWTTSEGETVVRRSGMGRTPGWENVILTDTEQSQEDLELEEEEDDPRQVYLGALFAPGVFRAATLARTVGIFRRNLENTGLDEATSWDHLKQEVVSAVEAEIQNSLTDYEVSDEDYLSISRAAWSRFYSCAAQYRAAGSQPMGLVTSLAASTILIVRKDLVSWCRPVEALEQVVMSEGVNITADVFADVPPLSDDPVLANDVLNLLLATGMIGKLLPASDLKSFRDSVYRQQSPDLVSRSLAAELLADQDQPYAVEQVLSRIQQVQNLARGMEVVLYCLELDSGSVSRGELDLDKLESDEPVPRVFSSYLGTSLVAASLRQQVETRLKLSQQLLVLQHILLDCSTAARIPPAVRDSLQSTFITRTTVMVNCYNVLSWLCKVGAPAPPSSVQELNLRQLAVLRISDKNATYSYAKDKNTSLLELFLNGPGRVVRVAVGECRGEDCWTRALPPMTNMSAQLLWPRCASSTFLNFLLRSAQYTVIQNYCRMLSTWCEWHPYARQFLLGAAYLNMGEEEKAVDLFISASAGIPADRFLSEDILDLVGDTADDLLVEYFLKVVSLLEQFPCPDLVIALTDTARAVCPQDHKERATLSYILFSYHLKLGHNEDAYAAMMSNPDASRRKDSLRQFLVTLFDRGQLSQLAGYPYTDMIDDVEAIIESRARSADLSVNNYYDFLYSFHVSKENFRKAAQVMFECGCRLGHELANLDGLKKQVQVFLSCINCLHLVSPKYRWLIKPCPVQATSPKRFHDGEEKDEVENAGMEVIELDAIKKELVLSQARLKLTIMAGASQGNLPASPGLTPAETVGFLTTANLYLSAIQICEQFNLSLAGVIEALTSKAVRLSGARPQDKSAAWQWLAENRPGGIDIQGDCAVAATWTLLEHLVSTKEKSGETLLHRVTVSRLFSLGATLPPWLVAGYKKRDAAELVRLYHGQGLLEAATGLVIEYLDAVLGKGGEYFGLETSLQANNRPAWVPWTVIDRLCLELSDNAGVPVFARCLDRLDRSVESYLGTVERVSRDMIANRAQAVK